MRLLLLSLALVGCASGKAIDKRDAQCWSSLQCDANGCKRWCPGPDGKGQWMVAVPEKREAGQIHVDSSNTAESSNTIEKREADHIVKRSMNKGPNCFSKDGEYKMCYLRKTVPDGPVALDPWGRCYKDDACNASVDSQPWFHGGKREADQIHVESSNTAESSNTIEKREADHIVKRSMNKGPNCFSKDGEYRMCYLRKTVPDGPVALDPWGRCYKDDDCNSSVDSQPWFHGGKREADQIHVESSNTAESSNTIEKREADHIVKRLTRGPFCLSKDGEYKMCYMRQSAVAGPYAIDRWGVCYPDPNCNASVDSQPWQDVGK